MTYKEFIKEKIADAVDSELVSIYNEYAGHNRYELIWSTAELECLVESMSPIDAYRFGKEVANNDKDYDWFLDDSVYGIKFIRRADIEEYFSDVSQDYYPEEWQEEFAEMFRESIREFLKDPSEMPSFYNLMSAKPKEDFDVEEAIDDFLADIDDIFDYDTDVAGDRFGLWFCVNIDEYAEKV